MNSIQRYIVEKTRLGIPIIVFDEAVHGLAREGATMFPQAFAVAATWDAPLLSTSRPPSPATEFVMLGGRRREAHLALLGVIASPSARAQAHVFLYSDNVERP